ncbi:glucosidase family protein [Nonlabens xiamenensis]|uniref:fructofuranosidase/invertase n=1 Tax=Nonlabens xiamenensis TaxID=2341043 RepID=UPI000F613C8E|nr:fructofuranosidase/invertase [Nonlabens xiamenensis]
MKRQAYDKAIDLLRRASTGKGFLASADDVSNYKRIWARDGVICGLAALASGDQQLIQTFRQTIATLAEHQHRLGTIPSNVQPETGEVSYGGLAGRVDALTWFVIGVCQLAKYLDEPEIVQQYEVHISKCLHLLETWEFNNRDLVYVPLSGNWADEYITDGYVLYDQLLRLWALRCYHHFKPSEMLKKKIQAVEIAIQHNFLPHTAGEKVHQQAYDKLHFDAYIPASFSPAGYKNKFDALATSLAFLLDIGDPELRSAMQLYGKKLSQGLDLKILPAFWPPVFEEDPEWHLLRDNCKFEFRNFPYEFHNGGSWTMVNGFYGLALLSQNDQDEASQILEHVNLANAKDDYAFYECFNSATGDPNGVSNCAWSASSTVMLTRAIDHNFKLFF